VGLMFLWGLLFNYGHTWAYCYPAMSVQRIFGIALSVTMIQVYRDGVVSLSVYLLYYFGPCAVIWLLSNVVGQRARVPASNRTPFFPAMPGPERGDRGTPVRS